MSVEKAIYCNWWMLEYMVNNQCQRKIKIDPLKLKRSVPKID